MGPMSGWWASSPYGLARGSASPNQQMRSAYVHARVWLALYPTHPNVLRVQRIAVQAVKCKYVPYLLWSGWRHHPRRQGQQVILVPAIHVGGRVIIGGAEESFIQKMDAELISCGLYQAPSENYSGRAARGARVRLEYWWAVSKSHCTALSLWAPGRITRGSGPNPHTCSTEEDMVRPRWRACARRVRYGAGMESARNKQLGGKCFPLEICCSCLLPVRPDIHSLSRYACTPGVFRCALLLACRWYGFRIS